jgi:hypothetical protein
MPLLMTALRDLSTRRRRAAEVRTRTKPFDVGDVLRPLGCGQTGASEIGVTGAVVVAIVAVPFLISSAGPPLIP